MWSSADALWHKFSSMYRIQKILFIVFVTCSLTCECIFKSGNKYTYYYTAETSAGVLLPSKAASSWGFQGKLELEVTNNTVHFQLNDLKSFVWNGKSHERSIVTQIKDQAVELTKPFLVVYERGLVSNFSVEVEPLWATNIKRSIAGILQLDLKTLETEAAFHSQEDTHYGRCTTEYVVTPESESKLWIRKFLDPRTCIGHPQWTWTNVPQMQCPTGDESPVIKSSERLYQVSKVENERQIKFINATGAIYVQPFRSFGEVQFMFTRQIFELIEVTDAIGSARNNKFNDVTLQHKLPDGDLSQGRVVHEKKDIFKTISSLLDRLSQRLENPGLDTEIDNLHNTTISILLYYLEKLDRSDLQAAYNNISGTSYKEETIRNMFLETVPQVGTKDSALFVLDLIQQKKVSDINAMQLLTQLPFHIRKPDVQFLVSLQPLINLSEKTSANVRNTGILTFGTLIYKTCLVYCPYEMLDDYVRLYLDKFTEIDAYEKKMVWLEGLANIQLGRVVEFLEPIASGNSGESRHLRVLAAWASLPTAPFRPDVIYPVYWPILVNRTEHLEMRIAALTLLIASNPMPNRIISLYWYMLSEPNFHLVNYFYTTLKSMERTNFPCYKHLGGIAAQFSRILQKPKSNENVVTGNYIFDYQDTKRDFGAMVQNIIIASLHSNIPEVAYITLNSHGSGTHFNQISLYIKASGVMKALSSYLESPGRVKDILREFKFDNKTFESPHVEIIARVQQKTVLCLHFNNTNVVNVISFLGSIPEMTYQVYQTMEFHLNQQRINIPLTMESVQATDLGTNVRLAATANSLFSIRGNFTQFLGGRNNHVILRTAVHGTEVVETYNPLNDIWHAAERAQSIHGYLPINVTVGIQDKLFLTYNTPAEYIRIGIAAHTRTTTTIRGINAGQKLKTVCPECSLKYTVKKNENAELQDAVIFDSVVPEIGGRLHVKVYDCDEKIAQEELFEDIWSSHQSNYQSWPAAKLPLLGFHFFDYFSYVPPKGSCGLAVYIEPSNVEPSQVKLEYMRSGSHHVFSLIRSELGSNKILQQWNLAAVYESVTWVSDTLKIKASRTVTEGKVIKVCMEIDRITPWTWDYFSLNPSDPASLIVNIVWELSDNARGRCTGSSILLNLIGEVSEEQVKKSIENEWPYQNCRTESNNKTFVPYSEACYRASREMSTLRKYRAVLQTENLPKWLAKSIRKLRAIYDLLGGNSSYSGEVDTSVIEVIFPKDSMKAEMYINGEVMPIRYNPDILDVFLTRTRLHRYIDNDIFRAFFAPCVLTEFMVKSTHNITLLLKKNREFLVLGQCYAEHPGFALTAISTASGIELTIHDNEDTIKLVPDNNGGIIYNFTEPLSMTRNFEWHNINDKRFRLDKTSIHVTLGNILPFIHFTKDQILLFFPSFIQEFTCGVCTARNFDDSGLFDKI